MEAGDLVIIITSLQKCYIGNITEYFLLISYLPPLPAREAGKLFVRKKKGRLDIRLATSVSAIQFELVLIFLSTSS